MGAPANYQSFRADGWTLYVLPDIWNENIWEAVLQRMAGAEHSKHPQVLKFSLAGRNGEENFYLKIFHRAPLIGSLKDLFRDSKAIRSLRQGVELSRLGFGAPLTVAAGERRSYRLLDRSFTLTAPVAGQAIPAFLRERYAVPIARATLSGKRHALIKLAAEVRALHELGFVHGDLVPSNILVIEDEAEEFKFVFIDNDRTRRYFKWLPHSLWKRNLVQLNRFPLPGITLQDRMRFLRRYLAIQQWEKRDRRLLVWLESKTRQRRKDCDHVETPLSFRQLMRWKDETPGLGG